MAFTDVEMAVLSKLVYDTNTGNMEVELHDILEINENKLRRELGSQYNEVIDGLMEKSKEYKITLAENDKKTGFAAMAVCGTDNDVTVVCRGTEGFNIFGSEDSRKDVFYGDYGLIAGTGETAQHKQMEIFLNNLEQKGYDDYYFSGHSLGGNLAMYAALYLAKTGKVKGVITFNAPNFNSVFCEKYKKEIEMISAYTTHYQNECDIVSSINGENVFGNVIICKTADNDTNEFDFDDHMLSSYDICNNSIVISSNDKSDIAITTGSVATQGDTIIKTAAVSFLLAGASGISIVASAGIALVAFVSIVITVAVVSYVVHIVKQWAFEHSDGYKYANSNPYILIDTDKMRDYAAQLSALSSRSKTLDRRMNSLYWNLGIEWDTIANLGRLLKAEVVLDYAHRLDQCADYLNETANEFENVEREIARMC